MRPCSILMALVVLAGAIPYLLQTEANASESELDQYLKFKRVFIFPGYDDVQGSLAKELDLFLEKYLKKHPRFEVVKNQKVVGALGLTKKTHPRIANSDSVHEKSASLSQVDGTILLKSRHAGGELRMRQEWRTQDGKLAFAETVAIPSNSSMQAQRAMVNELTQTIINRLPFQGTITGRTGNTLTIDLNDVFVQAGDVFEVSSISGIKRHPLLKTIVDSSYKRIGKARVRSSDSVLAFAQVTEEYGEEFIGVGNKVTRLNKKIADFSAGTSNKGKQYRKDSFKDEQFRASKGASGNRYNELLNKSMEEQKQELQGEKVKDDTLSGAFEEPKARYGRVNGYLLYANLDHEHVNNGQTTSLSSSSIGADFGAELWITKIWLFGFDYSLLNTDLEGTRGNTIVTASGTSWKRFNIWGGYRYLVEKSIEGTNIVFGFGYQSLSVEMPADTANELGKRSYSGILLQLIADIDIAEKNRLDVGLSLSPFATVTETGFTLGTAESANSVGVLFAYNYYWTNKLWISGRLNYDTTNSNYEGGNNSSEKRLAFGVGLKYAF